MADQNLDQDSQDNHSTIVVLPSHQPSWGKVKTALDQLSGCSSTSELLPLLGQVYRAAHPGQFNWHVHEPLVETAHPFVGLGHFLEHVATETELDTFFHKVLPTIAGLAGEIDKWSPLEGVQYSLQQQESAITLDRRFVASVIANAFLCTFPKRHNQCLNNINFEEFFQFLICSSTRNSQAAKLRCFLNYFDRLAQVDMGHLDGKVTYVRQVLKKGESISIEGWLDSKSKLCSLTVKHEGLIENAGSQALQVDFANRFIGGGTLLAGRQQEEIRFCKCPELLGALLIAESLQDNEALVVTGFEQFSQCSGYSSTLKFAGGVVDKAKKNSSGDLNNTLVAIDAMPWSGFFQNQFRPEHVLRELNKAYTGFCFPMARETSVPNGQDESESVSFHDALDHSLVSTDGTDFETASSGDGQSRKSSCSSGLHGYSTSLSRAITDIAVKDATGSFPSLSLPREESSHNSLSTILTASTASTPVNESASRDVAGSGINEAPGLERYAVGLIQDAMKEVRGGEAGIENEASVSVVDGSGNRRIPPDSEDGQIECQVEQVAGNIALELGEVAQTDNGKGLHDVTEAEDDTSLSIAGMTDSITEDEEKVSYGGSMATSPPFRSNESQGTPQSHHGGESRSSKGSLAEYSIISSASCPSSDSFVKISDDSDMAYGQRHPNQAFSADVLALDIVHDAMATLHTHFNVRPSIPTTISNDSLDVSDIPSETPVARDRSGSFDILTSGDFSSSPSLSEFVRVTSFSLDGFADDIMSSAFQQLQQILQDKKVDPSAKPLGKETNGMKRNNRIQPSEARLRKTEPKDQPHLTEEDIRNGNILPSQAEGTDQDPLRASIADKYAERLVGQVLNESMETQAHNIKKGHHDDPGTPPPSPTSPAEIETCLHTSQSFDKSLVTISEQPAIEEPHYFGDKRLSFDSSGTESSQSRDARIRECAEQLVARTLPESMRLLGGSAQTTSSSSSRRTSSPRSSIPNSSNRSSMDCFTEDLLKIGNIDPMGKRPSRTEESLAFFAQEIKRMAEAEEKSSKKQKEDFADFTIELQRGSTQAHPQDNPTAEEHTLDNLADRYSVQVISDVFVRLYGEPWSEAKHSRQPEEEAVPDSQQMETPSADCDQQEGSPPAAGRPYRPPSERDLISMATNLANLIIEAALKVYREEHLHVPSRQEAADETGASRPFAEDPRLLPDDHPPRRESLNFEEWASTQAGLVIGEAFSGLSSFLKDGGQLGQVQHEEDLSVGQRPISTGNWGCGAFGGDPQLKSLIQWMVASQVGCPYMIYYTFGDERVSRLQRVINETTARNWTVGDLLRAVLDHSWLTLNVDADPMSLFERVISSG